MYTQGKAMEAAFDYDLKRLLVSLTVIFDDQLDVAKTLVTLLENVRH